MMIETQSQRSASPTGAALHHSGEEHHMWTVTRSSWIARYNDYRTGSLDAQIGGPATVYYRKADIARVLQHYADGHPIDVRKLKPSNRWNDYSDVGYLVATCVTPYRIRR